MWRTQARLLQVHQLERTAQTVTDVSAPLVSERMCVGCSECERSRRAPDSSTACAATLLLSALRICAQRLRSLK